ncbi:MAG: hypothetical protein WB441_14320 [Nocardioidaceae bacterium]
MAVPSRTLRAARRSTGSYLDAVTSVLSAPRRSKPTGGAATDQVGGTALAQLVNQAAELAQNGQRVVGRPRVVSSVVTGRTVDPPTLTLAVCLDNSAVRVLDAQGTPLPRNPTADRPTRNILTLAQRAGRWVVVDQGFPDDPDC